MHDGALVPLGVRLAAGDAPLDVLVLDDLAFLEVEQEHLARGEAALALDVLGATVMTPVSDASTT